MRGERALVYCVVPRALADKLHEPLRRHFRDDGSVEVVVERRERDRRETGGRRDPEATAWSEPERRRIRAAAGRRVADRRATSVPVDGPPLPRRLERHRDALRFVERLEPAPQEIEDVDTARLVMRIQGGDREAFGELYLRYFDRVYTYMRVLLKSPHDAEDATQEVFERLLGRLESYERRSQPFRAWLFIVVRNHALNRMRREQRAEPLDPATLEQSFDRHASAPAEISVPEWITDRDLLLFVERLPHAQRQVLMLRYMLDLTHSQIAEVLGRSADDVRALHSRAIRFLNARLAAVGRGPRHGSRIRARRPVREARVLRSRRWALVP